MSGGSTAYSTPGYGGGGGGRGGHSFQKMQSENFTSSGGFHQKPRESNTIYVGNIGQATDRDSLSQAFQDMNLDVRKVNIMLNDQGKSKGAGFVTFGTSEEAAQVVEQCQRQGLSVGGNRLIVQFARQ